MTTTDNRPWFLKPMPPVCRDRGVAFDAERQRLTIREGDVVTRYAHERVDGADCDARLLHCLEDECSHVYTVVLAGRGSSCDCLENERYGHRRQCGHILSLLALQKQGRV